MNIFEYTNYRTYLVASIEEAKARNPRLTTSALAKKMGLKSNTSLIKILRGQRDPGPDVSRRLVHYFKMSEREMQYFEDLVSLQKAKKDPAKSYALMKKLKAKNRDFRLLNEDEFSAISNWWFYAIRQMTRLKSFDEDPVAISKALRFHVPEKEIRRAISIMLDLGVLNRDLSTGKLNVSKHQLNTSDEITSEAIRRFHEGMIENARASIRSCPVSERLLVGFTLGLKNEDIPRAKNWLDQKLTEFENEFESVHPDQVYQVQVQLFPLTKYKGDQNENK